MTQPNPAATARSSREVTSAFTRAIETERTYFELGATVAPLPGAVLAWMPGLSHVPAGSVVHRVNPQAVSDLGEGWIRDVERRLLDVGAGLARIYLDCRDRQVDALLRSAGYADRDELIFHHMLPDPPADLTLRPVTSDDDWARKLMLHEAVATSPDGHPNRASDWVALERRKCEVGMESYLAEVEGEAVGAIGAVWGRGLLRMKNIVVHPAHRRRSLGKSILSHIAAVGRARGVSEQCIFAVRGEPGEFLYLAAGMRVVGVQVEWSKQIAGPTT